MLLSDLYQVVNPHSYVFYIDLTDSTSTYFYFFLAAFTATCSASNELNVSASWIAILFSHQITVGLKCARYPLSISSTLGGVSSNEIAVLETMRHKCAGWLQHVLPSPYGFSKPCRSSQIRKLNITLFRSALNMVEIGKRSPPSKGWTASSLYGSIQIMFTVLFTDANVSIILEVPSVVAASRLTKKMIALLYIFLFRARRTKSDKGFLYKIPCIQPYFL